MRSAIFTLLLSAPAWVMAADNLPKPAPPFTVMRFDGPPMQISQFKGKLLVLTFIQTTCPHCQALTLSLAPIAKEYASKNVQFVECAFNQNAGNLVADFAKQYNPPFPVGWSTDAPVRAFLSFSQMDSKMFYVPHMVFIDANGMVRGDYPGESPFFQNPDANVRGELEKLIKAGAAAPTSTSAAKSTPPASSKKK